MAFDYSKLEGKIKEVFGTQGKFASAVNLSEKSLSKKLNNKSSWTQPEIMRSCELLAINNLEINLYFFNEKVQHAELLT